MQRQRMKKIEIQKKLESGICGVVMVDENSIEIDVIMTRCPIHLPEDVLQVDDDKDYIFTGFNVNTEKWESFPVSSVIDVEQLTGEGAENNESKLQASPEYLQDLFTDYPSDDLDIMEHPEDLYK